MKQTPWILALFATALMLPLAAVGKDDDGASQKSPHELRRDLWRAEKEFYSMYNKLNDDRLYDVRCTTETPTGSVIKTQICRPRFLDRALKEGNVNVESKFAAFRKNLDALVAANPELQKAALTLNAAHARVDADK